MDDDAWKFGLSTSSKYATIEPPYDDHIDFEEIEEDDDDLMSELACPYCSEDFDLVGLCCHIDDEHPAEAKTGICPVCAVKVGMTMAGHIIMKHEFFLKTLRKKKLCDYESHSTLSLSRKEFQDEHLQSLLEGSCVVSSSNMEPDPLLSSFFYYKPTADEPKIIHPSSSTEASLAEKSSDEQKLERRVQPSPLSDKDHEEKAQRCGFVQGLLFSTILDDNL
ncbi:hypothetical protein F0562_021450 [Nyssa sinensis]|uniref:Drought induced 19 protein type zinc-binding domain-containing protein n=1 Tax=Nyssa sinensis TaxID=561372 RepID=A0A5J5BIU1_9ASTE|nr:hypothetical protein F0562_021450 [Nyssa sinensis]